jgi:hypothetical protein
VGAIVLLACFLVVDGMQLGIFQLVEQFGNSTAWGLIGLVPTTVVSYLVGVFTVGAAEMLLARVSVLQQPSVDEIRRVAESKSPLLEQLYVEQFRNHELLKGASLAFLFLALGCVSEIRNMPGQHLISAIAISSSFLLSALSVLFARRAAARARRLSAAVS